MSILRATSQVFAAAAIIAALYDIVYFWVVEARFHIRSVGEWGVYLLGEAPDLSARMLNMPAFAACLILSVIFYVLYRAVMLAAGKGRAHRL